MEMAIFGSNDERDSSRFQAGNNPFARGISEKRASPFRRHSTRTKTISGFCEAALKSVYLIGSLRNEAVPEFGQELRKIGLDVFDDWYGAGKIADDSWQAYENLRGRNFADALAGYAAQHVFHFDKIHLDRCDAAILLLPAGKSGHLELGYIIGSGKPGFILMDKEPERYDVMYNFATGVYFSRKELLDKLASDVVPF
jgi:hypothetical protein